VSVELQDKNRRAGTFNSARPLVKRRTWPNHRKGNGFAVIIIFRRPVFVSFLPLFLSLLLSSLESIFLVSFTMAAVAAAAADAPAPEARVKPSKPDEEAYKASLAQAEKEHTAVQEKLV
jgi:hypothetical protein